MKLKILSAALVGAGLAAVGTAGAIDMPHWLKGDPQVASATSQPAPAADRVVPAVPMLPAGQVPNYRAIVKQSAPAVVGKIASLTSFGEDANGELFAVGGDGVLYALRG